MKSSIKVLLGVLFLAGTGIAMADDDHRDDHGRAKVIVVAPVHHRHHHHPKPHAAVILKVGDPGYHDDHH
jgi:hypothetical protein